MSRLRACWATHAPVGLAGTPRRRTRRVASSSTNNYHRRGVFGYAANFAIAHNPQYDPQAQPGGCGDPR
jgi:hypothetical protein